jgi:hypothetical protein
MAPGAAATANGTGGHGGGDSNNGSVVADQEVVNGNGKQRHSTRGKPAVNPKKDKYWKPIDKKEAAAAVEDGGEDGHRPLLFRTFKVKAYNKSEMRKIGCGKLSTLSRVSLHVNAQQNYNKQ